MGLTAAEVVDAFIAAIEQRDLDAACAYLAVDVEYDNVPMGKIHGAAEVHAALGPLVASCERVEWIVYRQTANDTIVMNERLDRFVMADKTVEIPVAGVFEVADGRITLWRDYFDLATFTNQM